MRSRQRNPRRSPAKSPRRRPPKRGGGVLATLARALGLDGGEEPAGPAVTVLGTQVSDPDALEDLID